jgi:hypothetical protein
MTAATTTGTPVATRSSTRPALARVPSRAVVAAETVFAAAVMAWTLGRQSLWFDESATADVMRRSVGSTLRFAVTREPTIGLYYVLRRPWSALFGTPPHRGPVRRGDRRAPLRRA